MTYATETAKYANQPSYIVRFVGLDTFQFSTAHVFGASRTTHIILDLPDGTQQRLLDWQNRATYGEIRIQMADKDGLITTLISTDKASPQVPTIVNRKVVLLAGYRNLNESDFVTRYTGEVRDVHLVGPGLYEFTVTELKRRWDEMLMADADAEPVATLEAVGAIGASSITLTSVPKALVGYTGSALLYRADGSQYDQVTVGSVNESTRVVTFSGSKLQSQWDQLSTDIFTTARHARGNIVNLLYSLLTDTWTVDPEAEFPLLAFSNAPKGLAIPVADIDVTLLKRMRDQLYSEFDVEFLWTNPVRARSFFEQQVFILGFFPFINVSGQIGIRAFVPPGPEVATPPTLKKEDMYRSATWSRVIERHVNRVVIRGDQPLGAAQGSVILATRENTQDQTDSAEVGELSISSAGLRTNLDGVALAQEIAARHLRRWQGPAIEVTAVAALTKRDLNIGDVPQVTDPDLPDTTTGTLGLTDREMEVTRVSVKFRDGEVEFNLFDHSLNRRWGWQGNSVAADYPVASAQEKKFAYWGNATNYVNNGTEIGYYVY